MERSARYVPQPAYAAANAYAEDTFATAPYPAQAYAPSPAPLRAPPPAPVAPPPSRPAARPEAASPPKPVAPAKPDVPPLDDEEDLPSDDELDKMLGPSRDTAAAKAFAAPVKDETTELDEEAIEKLPDPTPVRQIADEDEDLDLDEDIEPEDIPDPDPIPQVYGGGDDDEFADEDEEEAGGFSLKKLIAPTVSIVAVGALVAGLVVGRDMIVKLWPSANDVFYDFIGLHVMVPGDGLKREVTNIAIETVANVDHVIATGRITNVSESDQPVPTVLVRLVDAKIQVLDEKEIKIDKAQLQPGEAVQFKAVFVGAPATAREVHTEWGRFAESEAQ